MTKLVTRKEITEKKKIISSELTKMQKVFFDNDYSQFCENEIEKNEYLEMFDVLNLETLDIDSHYKIIGIEHKDINSFTDTLSEKLIELFKEINAKDFYIISHLKCDFFGNLDNKFKPLVKAYKKLKSIVGKDTYNEAFEISIENLTEFIEILFWTTRCDMSTAEYVFIFEKEEKFQIHMCKHGNLHLTEYNSEIITDKLISKLKWKIIEGQEYDNFTNDSIIKGRKIKM